MHRQLQHALSSSPDIQPGKGTRPPIHRMQETIGSCHANLERSAWGSRYPA